MRRILSTQAIFCIPLLNIVLPQSTLEMLIVAWGVMIESRQRISLSYCYTEWVQDATFLFILHMNSMIIHITSIICGGILTYHPELASQNCVICSLEFKRASREFYHTFSPSYGPVLMRMSDLFLICTNILVSSQYCSRKYNIHITECGTEDFVYSSGTEKPWRLLLTQ